MSTRVILAALAVAATAAHLSADTYVRQPGIRIAHYTFDITVGDTNDELAITESIDVRFTAAGVRAVDLDLCRLAGHDRCGD